MALGRWRPANCCAPWPGLPVPLLKFMVVCILVFFVGSSLDIAVRARPGVLDIGAVRLILKEMKKRSLKSAGS